MSKIKTKSITNWDKIKKGTKLLYVGGPYGGECAAWFSHESIVYFHSHYRADRGEVLVMINPTLDKNEMITVFDKKRGRDMRHGNSNYVKKHELELCLGATAKDIKDIKEKARLFKTKRGGLSFPIVTGSNDNGEQ